MSGIPALDEAQDRGACWIASTISTASSGGCGGSSCAPSARARVMSSLPLLVRTPKPCARHAKTSGIGIGLSAALMSIMTAWLADLKLGRCSTGWWLSRKFCCLEVSDEGESCEEWNRWGLFQPIPWVAYVMYAVSTRLSLSQLTTGHVRVHSGLSREKLRTIRCGLGNLGDQVYPGRFHYQGISRARDPRPQGHDSGVLLVHGITDSQPLAIGSGLAVGKEGPSVHVACAVGNVVARLFPRYRDSHRE